jgi:hypothetical protein
VPIAQAQNVMFNFMKRQPYILKIESPCKKDWTSMTGENIDRYCSHCSKSVSDLTQMTDDQILERIRKTNGKLCGRLTVKQLEREYLVSKQGDTNSLIPKFLSGLLLLGLTDNINANEVKTKTEIVDNRHFDEKGNQNKEEQTTASKDSLKNIIEGQVIDAETKEPLMFANVKLKDKKIGTVTDENGNFRLVIPDSVISEQITIVIKCVAYKETKFVIKATDLPQLKKILIIKAEQVLMGEVVIIKKKRWWQFWRRK